MNGWSGSDTWFFSERHSSQTPSQAIFPTRPDNCLADAKGTRRFILAGQSNMARLNTQTSLTHAMEKSFGLINHLPEPSRRSFGTK
jgi:hypothetical protein